MARRERALREVLVRALPAEELRTYRALLAGKAAGIKTVLVTPWQMETGRAFRLKRALEKPFLWYITRRMGSPY